MKNYLDTFNTVNKEYFTLPIALIPLNNNHYLDAVFDPAVGPPLHVIFCELNKPPYTMEKVNTIDYLQIYRKSPSKSSPPPAIKIEEDDYIFIDEISDEISMKKFFHDYDNSKVLENSVNKICSSSDQLIVTSSKVKKIFPNHHHKNPNSFYKYVTDVVINTTPEVKILRAIGSDHSHAFLPNQASSSSSIMAKSLHNLLQIPIPKLTIAILAVGTRGDIQPFILLGKRLKKDGHRVRIATHECFRNYVKSPQVGLEFYPLGGDPVKLSEYM